MSHDLIRVIELRGRGVCNCHTQVKWKVLIIRHWRIIKNSPSLNGFCLESRQNFQQFLEWLRTHLYHFIFHICCKTTSSSTANVKSKYRSTVENVEDALLYRIFRQDLILCAKDKGTCVSHQYALSLSWQVAIWDNIINITENRLKLNFFDLFPINVFFVYAYFTWFFMYRSGAVNRKCLTSSVLNKSQWTPNW